MNALLGTAAEIQHFLQRAGERFCFIGGVALQRWGEPRLTRESGGAEIISSKSPADCAAFMRDQNEFWSKLVKQVGVVGE